MKPIEFITALRATDEYIETIYMNGSCYQFHLFLRKMYPESEPFINKQEDHVITKIGRRFYDITGEIKGKYYPLTPELKKKVEEWSFYKNNWLKIGECSYCDEPITI
jgi:hypothetical protein